MKTWKEYAVYTFLMILALLILGYSFSHASDTQPDTLLTKTLYARSSNTIMIKLGAACNPCQVYWEAKGQGKKLIVTWYSAGVDTLKTGYDFQGFNSLENSLLVYTDKYQRSRLPFNLVYPIPESVIKSHKNAQAIVANYGYNLLGRPYNGRAMVVVK
jgi:hypothetical protein